MNVADGHVLRYNKSSREDVWMQGECASIILYTISAGSGAGWLSLI